MIDQLTFLLGVGMSTLFAATAGLAVLVLLVLGVLAWALCQTTDYLCQEEERSENDRPDYHEERRSREGG